MRDRSLALRDGEERPLAGASRWRRETARWRFALERKDRSLALRVEGTLHSEPAEVE
jgi:hypothetical protein